MKHSNWRRLSALLLLLALVAVASAKEEKTPEEGGKEEAGNGEEGGKEDKGGKDEGGETETEGLEEETTPVPEIIGGSIAEGSDYPFFALLYTSNVDASSYFCGGTLIKSDVVLTAAHCFDDLVANYVNIGPTLSFVQEEFIEVDSITIHPRYTKASATRDWDFAIVKLKTHSQAPTASINLDTNFPSLAGTPLETIGFGKDSADPDANPTEILKRVDLEFVPFGLCVEQAYPGISPNLHDCATGFLAGPCDGDNGGPLLLAGTDILIGVFSFGPGCQQVGVDVFSKVADNFHWISTTAGFPPTSPPTHPPTVAPTKDSNDSHDPPATSHPAPTPAPSVTLPCHWFWELGDAIFEWVDEVRGHN